MFDSLIYLKMNVDFIRDWFLSYAQTIYLFISILRIHTYKRLKQDNMQKETSNRPANLKRSLE